MSLPRASASFSEEILDAAREFMTGRIEVVDPGNVITAPYDPIDDEGGESSLAIILTNGPGDTVRGRPARIQQINMPSESAGAGEWATKRRFRFQVEILAGDPVLSKGQIVTVLDGGRDPSLTAFTYTILSAVNSTQAALRTIECVSEGRV